MASPHQKIGFVGAGRAATALALALHRAGYQVAAAASRTPASARTLASKLPACKAFAHPNDLVQACDLVFLTVPDDAIGPLAAALPWRKGQGVVHCSGALSLDVLSPAKERGALVGCLHPLQTFATGDRGALSLSGSTFAVEGEGAMGEWLEEMVRRLGGHAIHVCPEDRPLYHAAAVMSCGYVATLLDAAIGLWEAMGFSREVALRALLPLARGTLDNVESLGLEKGATGPILRGDAGTVGRHLAALSARAPEALPLYCQAGLAMVELALKRGSIGPVEADEIRALLNVYLASVAEPADVGAGG